MDDGVWFSLSEYEAVRAAVSVPCCAYPDVDAVLLRHPR